MIKLEIILVSLAFALVTVGCGCREEASSDEADSRATTAKRWRQDPPAQEPQDPPPQEPPKSVPKQPNGKNDPAHTEVQPADDRPEPATSPNAKQTENPSGSSEATSSNQGPGMITLSTNDCDVWPSYDWPLEMKIEVLEVPERITTPAPPIPDD